MFAIQPSDRVNHFKTFQAQPKKRDILLLHLDTKYEWLEIWLGYFAITCGYTKCMKYESWLNMFYSYFSGYTSSIWIWDRLNDYTKYHYWSKILRPFAGRRIDELDPRWFRSLFGAGEPSWRSFRNTLWLCQHSYWKWPFIVNFPINNGDFP